MEPRTLHPWAKAAIDFAVCAFLGASPWVLWSALIERGVL